MLSDHIIAKIAHVVYAAVRVWKLENGETDIPEWEAADTETRDVVTARAIRVLSDARAGDSTFHNEWMVEMAGKGWTFAKVYDERRKTDPMMAPFHLLPYEHQAKERLLRAVVLSLSRI